MNENPDNRFPMNFGECSRPGCQQKVVYRGCDNKVKVALLCLNKKNEKKLNCQERDFLGILISQVDVRNDIRRLKNQDK